MFYKCFRVPISTHSFPCQRQVQAFPHWHYRPDKGKKVEHFFVAVLAHSSSIFERLSTPRNSRNSLTQASPPSLVPKQDLIVITKSGIYPQDVSDSDLIVNDEALDIAAKQVRLTFSLECVFT